RISVPLNLIYALPVSVVGSVKVMLSVLSAAPAVDGTHTHSALFIHFFSGVLIQQHIRRKTTSRGTAVNVVALAHPPTIAVCSGVTYPLSIVIRAHPACVDV